MKLIDRLMFLFGYVPKERAPGFIPAVGDMARPKNKECPDVEIIAMDSHSVRYRFPDGRTETRCRRGFVKNHSRLEPGKMP